MRGCFACATLTHWHGLRFGPPLCFGRCCSPASSPQNDGGSTGHGKEAGERALKQWLRGEEPGGFAALQGAALQVDEAADRLKGTEQAMLDAQKELANRTMLATKMSEAKAVSVSAEQLANMLDQRSSEAEQRQQDAQLAKEHARQAVQRKQEASESLAGMRTKERDALEAVAELQRTLSSSEPSETSES